MMINLSGRPAFNAALLQTANANPSARTLPDFPQKLLFTACSIFSGWLT